MSFYDDVQTSKSLIKEFDIDSDTLWIMFGGINGGLGIKIYEFSSITKLKEVKKIFVRDRYQSYYHKGLENIAEVNNIDSMVIYIKKLIEDANVKRVVFIGNSAGGYISLLLGKLLNIDEVHAFSPSTVLNIERLPDIAVELAGKFIECNQDRRYYDLKNVFMNDSNNNKTTFNLYYDCNSIDKYHAENLRNLEGVRLHPYNHGGHALIKFLKQNGELKKILDNIK